MFYPSRLSTLSGAFEMGFRGCLEICLLGDNLLHRNCTKIFLDQDKTTITTIFCYYTILTHNLL